MILIGVEMTKKGVFSRQANISESDRNIQVDNKSFQDFPDRALGGSARDIILISDSLTLFHGLPRFNLRF